MQAIDSLSEQFISIIKIIKAIRVVKELTTYLRVKLSSFRLKIFEVILYFVGFIVDAEVHCAVIKSQSHVVHNGSCG